MCNYDSNDSNGGAALGNAIEAGQKKMVGEGVITPRKTIRAEVEIPANRPFGFALECLKGGRKVTRHGWNGKGMWLELQHPDRNSKMTLPYVFLCYPRDDERNGGARVPWLASQTDMLAEDWAVFPDAP